MPSNPPPQQAHWGPTDYRVAWERMQAFTEARGPETPDALWTLQHPPVYTVGRNGRGRPARGDIPLVHSDRGGDITYHGPGQVLLYVLLDLGRLGLGVRGLVEALEATALTWLAGLGIPADRRLGAPGVYVGDAKIAALGLRIRRGYSYHGLAVNVHMDLAPFASIVPCGLTGIGVTQASDFGPAPDPDTAARALADLFQHRLYA